jgi:predicted dehydrogenase
MDPALAFFQDRAPSKYSYHGHNFLRLLDQKMRKLSFGLIGCGFISQWGATRGHIPAIKSVAEASLAMVCDISEDVAKKVSGSLKVPYTTDHHKLLERKDVDAVIVAVPHKYHKEISIDACNSGKHVLCEKPLAMTVSEVDEMQAASEKNHVVLMTAENYLFDPGVQLITRFMDAGLLGKVQTVELEEIGSWCIPGSISFTWRVKREMAGGGVLLDSGVHLTALAAHFAGGVSALTGKMAIYYPQLEGKKVDVEDHSYAILEHQKGALTLIHVSGINRFPYHKIELHGDKGSVQYHDALGKPEMKISGFEHTLPSLPSEFPSAESYKNELKHFIECVTHDTKPIADVNVGRKSLELVLKAYESSERKQRIVL